jgi:hypothetical protein
LPWIVFCMTVCGPPSGSSVAIPFRPLATMMLLRISVPALPPAMVMPLPPSQPGPPLPMMRLRSMRMAAFWLLPPSRAMPAPPAPVMVSPRIVTKRDCWMRIACPCPHCATAPCSTTAPAGAAGSAWTRIRLASVHVLAFLPMMPTCST